MKEFFDMTDQYANQEDAMATENNDRPHQKERTDVPESSKPKDRKRKGDDMVAQPSAVGCPELPARTTSRR